MNWRRGLFRLWIVGSVLFVLAIAFIGYSEIKAQFNADAAPPPPQGAEMLVPQLCGEARGDAGTDYTTQKGQNPGPWDKYAKPEPKRRCDLRVYHCVRPSTSRYSSGGSLSASIRAHNSI
jgi:hypothetical protein